MKVLALVSQKGGSGKTPVYMYQRAAYSHAINAGHSVEEYEPGGKAAEEIRALYNWTPVHGWGEAPRSHCTFTYGGALDR